MDMLITPVYHKKCGGHLGYTDQVYAKKEDSRHFILLNGKHPCSDNFKIGCLKCGKYVCKFDMTVI